MQSLMERKIKRYNLEISKLKKSIISDLNALGDFEYGEDADFYLDLTVDSMPIRVEVARIGEGKVYGENSDTFYECEVEFESIYCPETLLNLLEQAAFATQTKEG